MTRTELDRAVKAYILDAIDTEGYDVKTPETDQEKLQFLSDTFRSEMQWNIDRIGEHRAFEEWLKGLPSAINIDFENYRILEIAKEWGSIPENATERREEKILENWWNLITVKTFQLFRKFKVN